MKHLTDEAIVLHTKDYGEADRLVTMFTRTHGKLVGIAKHARRSMKRFLNSLETFSHIKIEFTEKDPTSLIFIKGATLKHLYPALRSDPIRFGCAALFVESLIEGTAEREAQQELYDLLAAALYAFESDADPVNVLCLSLWRFLKLTGILPSLNYCRFCGENKPTNKIGYFEPRKGDTVCQDHRMPGNKYILITRGTVSLLQKATFLPLDKLWRLKLAPDTKQRVLDMEVSYIQNQIEKRLKSMAVLSQLL